MLMGSCLHLFTPGNLKFQLPAVSKCVVDLWLLCHILYWDDYDNFM